MTIEEIDLKISIYKLLSEISPNKTTYGDELQHLEVLRRSVKISSIINDN
jgi:hypothetical protein